ncbi:unnamed protein product [Prorocentrum cordatum]|uniref:Beta-galactosidase n=1 Tax=Prorocentrum cordatum TaxID=2364126 RepID=A0ABN9XK62_9DINO|nr:unnamed protein product [Polarella glacialis]
MGRGAGPDPRRLTGRASRIEFLWGVSLGPPGGLLAGTAGFQYRDPSQHHISPYSNACELWPRRPTLCDGEAGGELWSHDCTALLIDRSVAVQLEERVRLPNLAQHKFACQLPLDLVAGSSECRLLL